MEPARRSTLLDAACPADPELRHEVESLIGCAERAEEMLPDNARPRSAIQLRAEIEGFLYYRIVEVLQQASELNPESRERFLIEVCAGNEVYGLLPSCQVAAAISLRATIFSAIHRPFLACEGLHDGVSLPDVPLKLFRGRPVHSNSIFAEGIMLFPQMDVWSR
jgi:hypothetical protein